MYSDNEFKFVAVLNRKVEPAQLFNALGHITVGLANGILPVQLDLLDYRDGDGSSHPGISRFPFIVLQADNGNQLRTLRQKLIDESLPYTDFVNTMLGSSANDQLAKTLAARESELEYFAICTFGRSTDLAPLIKKFSVYRLPSSIPATNNSQV